MKRASEYVASVDRYSFGCQCHDTPSRIRSATVIYGFYDAIRWKLKMRDIKFRNMKIRDNLAGRENTRNTECPYVCPLQGGKFYVPQWLVEI